MYGLLHTLALTKRLGKQAKIARARDVKLYFRLFRYVNHCVNARWSNVVRNNQWWASAALGDKTASNSPPHRLRIDERVGLLLPTYSCDHRRNNNARNKREKKN